ncbi:Retrovirus-related Pol polyprotein from transposon 17.6 [Araneus ventricosus]|uniref:Retrovirus-related Pol polyprotein from transposon 17.6 n=1 Tax=Araneus ventricosus TaxID=182803 RepID=A0A4Y2I092_ARAVE|nr:Retrovirus-related Pol polyprotein from transposon 17.6 [Araneus ventricosus]
MPFGLSNDAATFQRFVHHVLSGMDFCVPYFDDVLVASESEIQHLEHLKQVLQRFEGSFVPNAARTQAVPNAYLKGARKNDKIPITWTEETKNAFEKCKHDLAEATVLYHPSTNATLAIVVDASENAVRATLQQQVTTSWQPLAFYSNSLSPAQRRYYAYDRELLAAYMPIKYFRHMVEGRSFILFTDHKPLTFAFRQKEDKCSPRQLRQQDLIGQFTTDIRHLKGTDNVIADVLSRIHISPLDYHLQSTSKRWLRSNRQILSCKIFCLQI